jgi:hypothetical protein
MRKIRQTRRYALSWGARAMLGMSPAVAAIAGAVVGVVLAVVGRAAEPALVVTSCAAAAAWYPHACADEDFPRTIDSSRTSSCCSTW